MPYNLIPVVIVGPESWKSFGVLNPNAFPPCLKPDVMACADKLALISYSIQIIQREVDRDLSEFVKELNRNNAAFKGFIPDPEKPAEAIYHNMGFQLGVQSFFITTKSMLDIYARIIQKAIKPDSTPCDFNKAIIRGKEVAGGRVLNFLERCVPKSYENKEKLIGVLRRHIDNWIGDAVKLRDEIAHKGILSDLREMRVPLSKKPQQITKDDIILPTIRDKGDLSKYCAFILKGIGHMLEETLVLLPNVDMNSIAPYRV